MRPTRALSGRARALTAPVLCPAVRIVVSLPLPAHPFLQLPTNGLVVYTGLVMTDEGKEKKVNIDFEPFKPINTSLYMCDNKFHTAALSELLESDNKCVRRAARRRRGGKRLPAAALLVHGVPASCVRTARCAVRVPRGCAAAAMPHQHARPLLPRQLALSPALPFFPLSAHSSPPLLSHSFCAHPLTPPHPPILHAGTASLSWTATARCLARCRATRARSCTSSPSTCPRSTDAAASRRCALRACAWRSGTTTCARCDAWWRPGGGGARTPRAAPLRLSLSLPRCPAGPALPLF